LTDQTYKNIPELLRARVDQAPGKIFLFSYSDGREFTYSQFDDAVSRLATLLTEKGLAKGDVVSLLMPNSVEYVIAYFACWRIGALAGPINSLLKSQEIAYVISNSQAKALLLNSEYLPVVEPLLVDLPTLQSVITFDNEADATKGISPANHSAEISAGDEAIIIYTSGTTGKPKGCLLTHGNVVSNARQISQWLGFNTKDRLLTMMPLFHMNAVSVTTMSALYAGGSSVVSQKFTATRFWQIISDYQISSFGSVATMLSMLLSA